MSRKCEKDVSLPETVRKLTANGDPGEAYRLLLRAIAASPRARKPYMQAALFEYDRQNWIGAIYWLQYALLIHEKDEEESAWGSIPYDLLAAAYYRLGMTEKAREIIKSQSMEPVNGSAAR